MVLFDTGTNFPAVNWKALLVEVIMKMRQRWNGSADPTHPESQTASRTPSACTKIHKKHKTQFYASWKLSVDCVWNVMAHAQKPDFVFRRNGRVRLNRRGRQSSRLLTAEVCASAVVMLDTPCFEVVWRVLAIHSIHQFPLYFPSRASPCAITFQLDSTATTAGILDLSSFQIRGFSFGFNKL
jgi:hypothetical protein